jgi:hypothetical protein
LKIYFLVFQIEAALAYDGIQVIHKTLAKLIAKERKIFKHTFRHGDVYNNNKTKGVPCESNDPWMHGKAIMAEMRNVSIV